MKKTKISMLAALAILSGIAVSAFTAPPVVKHTGMTNRYIQFTGQDNSDDEIQAPENWQDLGTQPPSLSCSSSSGIVCFVQYNGSLSSFQTYVSDKSESDLETAGLVQEHRP